MSRKISNKGGDRVTGHVFSYTNDALIGYESQLERDEIFHLDANRRLISFESQPPAIPYYWDGAIHWYTADYLANRRATPRKVYVEVKPQAKLVRPEVRQKFAAIEAAILDADSDFMIVTEKQIRVEPKLPNLKLLHRFRSLQPAQNQIVAGRDLVGNSPGITIAQLADYGARHGIDVAIAYALVAHRILSVRMTIRLGPNTQLFLGDLS